MLTENLAKLFERDLLKLKAEIGNYTDESKCWLVVPGISNSAGNLCLHLLGNLQHFIGGVLGNSGYVRNRPAEFSLKNISVTDMHTSIDITISVVTKTLHGLHQEDLAKEYPEKINEQQFSVELFLLHLLGHLNYHLGQINYHRRLLDKE